MHVIKTELKFLFINITINSILKRNERIYKYKLINLIFKV